VNGKPGLVASDVDGTLLDALEGVSPRTLRALVRVSEAGVPVVLASGRPPRWMPRIARVARVNGYAVCANGAVTYHMGADEVISARTIDPVLLRDVGDALIRAIPGAAFAAERVGARADATDPAPFVAEPGYAHPWGHDPRLSVPRAEVLGQECTKLLVRHPEMTSEEMIRAARSVLGEAVDLTYSTGDGLLEATACGVSKASGLAEVAERLGVHVADVLAFGDMPNDLPMLRWAGHGVAMANAHPSLLDSADEVTASNADDGVATVLERWF
jgi:Cof subfamily protein (haloacid dehalogenase superfamily)